MLCLLSFWLLLRQTLTERWERQKEDSAGLSDVHVEDQEKKGNVYIIAYSENDISFGKCIVSTNHNYYLQVSELRHNRAGDFWHLSIFTHRG